LLKLWHRSRNLIALLCLFEVSHIRQQSSLLGNGVAHDGIETRSRKPSTTCRIRNFCQNASHHLVFCPVGWFDSFFSPPPIIGWAGDSTRCTWVEMRVRFRETIQEILTVKKSRLERPTIIWEEMAVQFKTKCGHDWLKQGKKWCCKRRRRL
jgi:hypothetical protein